MRQMDSEWGTYMKVAALLPVKGSNDRTPNKNTMLDGEPLFLRWLKKFMNCISIDEFFHSFSILLHHKKEFFSNTTIIRGE